LSFHRNILLVGVIVGFLYVSCANDSGMNSDWPSSDGENSPALKLAVNQVQSTEGVLIEIVFSTPEIGQATLSIHNATGQKIATLLENKDVAGTVTVEWNTFTSEGDEVVDGFYIYRLYFEGTSSIFRAYKVLYLCTSC